MENLKFYNWSEVRLPAAGADSLAVKLTGTVADEVKVIDTVCTLEIIKIMQ